MHDRHQQQKLRQVDKGVLEWCSRAKELLLQDSNRPETQQAPSQGLPLQGPLFGFQTGIISLPACKGQICCRKQHWLPTFLITGKRALIYFVYIMTVFVPKGMLAETVLTHKLAAVRRH